MNVRFQILGSLVVETNDGCIGLDGPRRRALLIRLLVSANRTVPAERLVIDLWEGSPPPGATSTLRSHIVLLRKAVGPARIRTDAGGYRVVIEDGELDVASFDEEMRRARVALEREAGREALSYLRAALAWWRGIALVDVAHAPWAQVERARLEEERASAIELMMDVRLSLGQHHDVVAEARAAVEETPFRERRWGQLMLAQYRSGRQAEALRTFQRLRSLLAEELGIEPSERLTALEHAMVLQRPQLTWRSNETIEPGSQRPSATLVSRPRDHQPRRDSTDCAPDDELSA